VPNDITQKTPASFEPSLDYVVVKVPRFAFEKFPAADPTLTTTMKSVGEAMSIGRNFTEALQKALRSMERSGATFHWDGPTPTDEGRLAELLELAAVPTDGRIVTVQQALRAGGTVEQVHAATGIDPWFLDQIALINAVADRVAGADQMTPGVLRLAKRHGFSDAQIASLRRMPEAVVRGVRHALGVRPVYKTVDTCAAEFAATTPYYYSTYDEETEVLPRERPAVIILGSGPNRIGQGVEFDYCCVRAALALREQGYETIMINSNPETVSTDFDISDKLYFEPLTFEDVLEIVDREQPIGVIVQLGGQTPLKLTRPLARAGVTILGTSADSIDAAEDRRRFEKIARELGVAQPPNGTVTNVDEALAAADRIGYPVLLRPSYVLGGRAMEIVYDAQSLVGYFQRAVLVSEDRPVLVDRFLEDAYEADVDAISDGTSVVIGGVMQHIEDAGIHSGDSACVLPPFLISDADQATMRAHTVAFARALGVVGLINAQYAIKDGVVYVLEVNPRASRTIPFVSKTIGVPLASLAARVMLGESLEQVGLTEEILAPYVAVKEAVFPFDKFREFDPILGPEMRSTGEVMGIATDFGMAFAKAQLAAGNGLPLSGAVLITVNDADKPNVIPIARRFHEHGFTLLATGGTARYLRDAGIPTQPIFKVHEGRPNGIDLIVNGEVQLLLNTPLGMHAQRDDYTMRQAAIAHRVPYTTTLSAASAACDAIGALRAGAPSVQSLQEWHAVLATAAAGR